MHNTKVEFNKNTFNNFNNGPIKPKIDKLT